MPHKLSKVAREALAFAERNRQYGWHTFDPKHGLKRALLCLESLELVLVDWEYEMFRLREPEDH